MMRNWVCAGLIVLLGCGGKSNHNDGDVDSGGHASSQGGNSSSLGGNATSLAGNSSSLGGASPTSGGALGNAATGNVGASSPAGGNGGTGGSAGSNNPGTVVMGPVVPTDQLDLLLMIDNSISMTDKQEVLAGSLPSMLLRLTSPNCLDAQGNATGEKADPSGNCSRGTPEFAPVRDLHVGVITSSLGGHGSQTCADSASNDRAQLLPLVRTNPNYPVDTWNQSGFLAWDPGGKSMPPGEKDLARLTSNFNKLVLSAGQTGCGFEAQLESWYRFLIDPDPPVAVPQVTDASFTRPMFARAADNPILQQRAQFLRPNSIVAVLMLTDENDCSIMDSGQGWLVGTQTQNGSGFHMPRATSVCETDPNSPCCASCLSNTQAAGCPRPADDVACQGQTYLEPADDALNLRCFKQRQRFGFDLLYPVTRYIEGLTRSMVQNSHLDSDSNAGYAPNPLFPAGSKRTASMVFLAGIVGVPWQDLATKASLAADTPLEYLPFAELSNQGRWKLVLGDDDQDAPTAPPGDKLMFETHLDRTTLFGNAPHPLIGSAGALAPSTSVGFTNTINGHEANIVAKDDLQYACIFPLNTPRTACNGVGCECDRVEYNPPLCDGPTQLYAKAYPSVRELRVLKGVGDISGNTVATSICPKSIDSTAPSGYGYVPAMSALVTALESALK
jgi:hypothetical protein